MGLFSFIGDLLGGGGTTVTTTQAQDINFNPTTNVTVDNEGIAQGIASLGESIGEGISEQQDIININVDTVDEDFNEQLLTNISLIKDNIITVAVIGGLIFLYFKFNKGGKSAGFKLQLPKTKLIS